MFKMMAIGAFVHCFTTVVAATIYLSSVFSGVI